MKTLFVFLVIVAAIVLPLVQAVPAHAADDNCCSPVKTVYCYVNCAPSGGLLDDVAQQQNKTVADAFYLRAGLLASKETGLQINITTYGVYTAIDPNTHRVLDGVGDVSVENRMNVSRIAGTGY